MSNFVETFERSLARLASDRVQFFDRFYETFIGSHAEVAKKFEGVDMARQKDALRHSLHDLAIFFVNHRITPSIERLARVHGRADRDIRPELYEVWLDSLIAAAREVDPEFDDRAELAFRLVLAPGIELMKFYYDREVAP